MREIKFRCWNGEKFCFVTLDHCGTISTPSLKHMKRRGHGEDHVTLDINHGFQQYTGLKDKNGKEIYEGDILGLHEYAHLPTVIAWSNAESSWVAREYETGRCSRLLFSRKEQMEIIGNIHENPDLIEG